MPQPRVYYYQNPTTGEHLTAFLPPDHPEMMCLQQGGHEPQSKFGILGKCCASRIVCADSPCFRCFGCCDMVPTWNWLLYSRSPSALQALWCRPRRGHMWLNVTELCSRPPSLVHQWIIPFWTLFHYDVTTLSQTLYLFGSTMNSPFHSLTFHDGGNHSLSSSLLTDLVSH